MSEENTYLNDTISADYEAATGKILFNMTNDYMFRAVLQKNNRVLRGLIKSLLHMSEEDIKEVKITNPIILGESINAKQMWLDVNVILNNSIIINLEMQIADLQPLNLIFMPFLRQPQPRRQVCRCQTRDTYWFSRFFTGGSNT